MLSVILRVCGAEDGCNRQEEIDDIEVKIDSRVDIFVVGVALDHVVGVVDDETGEYYCGEAAIDGCSNSTHWEKDLHGSSKNGEHLLNVLRELDKISQVNIKLLGELS